MMEAFQIDKQLVRLAFEKSAGSYDEAAVLKREIGDRLLERLEYIRFSPARILDVGAGTGYCTQALARQYAKAQVYALDLAHNMLRKAQGSAGLWQRLNKRFRYITGDAEQLPLADASVDMIIHIGS